MELNEIKTLLARAGVSVVNFAKACGIHRVTVSMWINSHTAQPRGLYWQRASDTLARIEKGLEQGVFPMHGKRGGYNAFVTALNSVVMPAPQQESATI